MSDGTAEEALRRIFRVFDINGDGQITEKELKRLVKDMFKLVKEEAPEEVDYLQIQKEVTICKIGVWVEYWLANHDLSGDKTVSYRKCLCWNGPGWKWKSEWFLL